MWILTFTLVLSLGHLAVADLHHLFTSAYRSPHMFSLAYDTVTNSLTQTGSFTPHGGHPWLSWGPDRSMLYGAERDGWSSYSVTANNEITFRSNLTLRGRCDGRDFKHGTTSILAEQKAPFNIYGAGRSPCGNVMATRVDGSLERIVQNITYQPESRVHGMALDPEGSYLYSADTKANGIWIHKVDTAKGTLSRAKFKTHGEANSRPRRLALHPGNKFLYMLLSKTNKLVVYSIKMEANGPVLTDTGLSYNLVAPGVNGTRYRGQEVALSADNNILYVTSRYRVQRRRGDDDEGGEEGDEEGEDEEDGRVGALNDDEDSPFTQKKRKGGNESEEDKEEKKKKQHKRQLPWAWLGGSTTSTAQPAATPSAAPEPTILEPGFLTAILLNANDGAPSSQPRPINQEPGYPIQMILQVATSTSGGRSNSIAPAPWANDHVVLTDSEKGLVQIWRFDGLADLPRSSPAPQPPAAVVSPQGASPTANPRPQNPRPITSSTPLAPPPVWTPNPNAAPISPPNPVPPPNQEAASSPSPNPSIQWTPLPSLAQPSQNTRPPPWQNPNPNTAPYGSFGKFKRQISDFNDVRANIVAEWKAPVGAVGEGDPAAPRGSDEKRRNDDGEKAPAWGRGCCANAVWYD